MRPHLWFLLSLAPVGIAIAVVGSQPAPRRVNFATDVLPVLRRACFECHGATQQWGGLRLDNETDASRGGITGPAIVKRDAAKSAAVKRIRGSGQKRMPPIGYDNLTPREMNLIERWIDQGAEWNEPEKLNFENEILPIFQGFCLDCHGSEKQGGQLRLDNSKDFYKGGQSKAPVAPGRPEHSVLMDRILGKNGEERMPFGRPPLRDDQIAKIKRWIEEGAHWPQELDDKKHWAYIPPVRPELPKVGNPKWPKNEIDYFVLARLDKEKLKPSPEADKTTLVRRLSLDLTGLPPSPEEVDQFLADNSPNAYEKLADRLLASPHYGERMAQKWLDLARYADTNGYEKDLRRDIWPYRDWVIQAFNQDMPYDRFTMAQLAGDLMPEATDEDQIATGFSRNTMFNEEGGVDADEARWLRLLDRVNTTGTVWMGATIECAQCHNHKYDPFSQREYYQLVAFFEPSEEIALDLTDADKKKQREALQKELEPLDEQAKKGEPMSKELADKIRKQISALQGPTTLILKENGAQPQTYFRHKGSFLQKGDLLPAGTPAALNPWPSGVQTNRLGLAQWLTDPKNPLTARVLVNRLWEMCFGTGIVETSENFGLQGEPPSHPELLDWLATEAIAQKWSIKKMLKTIVMSATYRQSSKASKELIARDPNNRLIARGARFRLDAELLRDNALAASGLLSRKIGGPSVFPYQPDGIWDIPYNGDQWKQSEGEDRYRRGLYTFWRRTSPYPAMVAFDATSREYCTVRRARTNTPLQALVTLNDPAYFEAAIALAKRVIADSPTDPITRAFRLCTARKPKASELKPLKNLYNKSLENFNTNVDLARNLCGEGASAELAAMTMVANVILNLDETLTKE